MLEEIVLEGLINAVKELYGAEAQKDKIQIQKTRKDFEGDFTIVVFPLLRISKSSPDKTANEIGEYLSSNIKEVKNFNVIKGFLNLVIHDDYWKEFLLEVAANKDFGKKEIDENKPAVMVEFSSPNTNKPLHLGHIRNNLLGYSVSKIIKEAGRKVVKVNLVNDRGIHICKSMLAWQKFGNGETPESSGLKGDHLVGKYYVKFDQVYKVEVKKLVDEGMTKAQAEEKSPLMNEAREMLRKWEANDQEVRELWETMNAWVYAGFDKTYETMGVKFDKIYYESNTYKLGKTLVEEGLKNNVLERREDNSVWADLTADGLDSKLLLRSDGTSVYMTQDLGTARQRFSDYDIDKHIYVVGNEQNYHFQVLSLILKKLGFKWAESIYHLSYGMVELPEGKMKSREGTVVDADDLMEEMIKTAREMSDELGKLSQIPEKEKGLIFKKVGLGALKYFILKVDPRKNMTFNPSESIDFNGNTGPFIQYTYARIRSVMRKSEELEINNDLIKDYVLKEKEISLIKTLYEYPAIMLSSAKEMNPALIANHLYEIAKEFNQFYHDHSILKAESDTSMAFRLKLAEACCIVIGKGMSLLGIEVPERM